MPKMKVSRQDCVLVFHTTHVEVREKCKSVLKKYNIFRVYT